MRRQLFLAYLVLLAASTCMRWKIGALGHGPAAPVTAGLGDGSPVVILADEGTYANELRLIGDLGVSRHQATVIWGGTDPDPVLAARPVHLIALGAAGPEAIHLAAREPDRVRSLILFDADGVEEFDLLGDHHLNQVLRRAEVVSIEVLKALLPTFGTLDLVTWRAENRARRLLGYDRRTIRADLARWDGPTAIVTSDASGGIRATAREHHRVIPQSRLIPWSSDSVRSFLAAVDAGTAPTRATADPARVAAAALPFDAGGLASAQGVSLIIVLALLALTTLLSEDVACIAAGVLAARGSIPLWPGILACYIGIVVGDQLLYLLGRSAGRAIVTRVPFNWILPAHRLEWAYDWFRTNGMKVVLTSRLIPGTRSTVYVAAGILKADFVKFALWLVVFGAVWTPALVGLSYVAARQGRGLIEALPGPTWPWALAAMAAGVLLIHALLAAATPEGRSGLLARWRQGVKR